MKPITVLLAEDHTVVREGFRRMLELEQDFQVLGEAQDGREAVALVSQLHPRVVLMDIAMPRLNGLEATRQILKTEPEARILILSAHNEDAYVQSATESGAAGFLLKSTSSKELCRAIREVAAGRSFFGPSVAKRLQDQFQRGGLGGLRARTFAKLTSREVEVLQLIAEGKANKETAAELGISIKTVEKHRQALMEKLNIHDTASLTRYAIANGVVESSVPVTIV